MSKYMEKAEELRAITTPHYNCAQSVLMAFGDLIDLSPAALYNVAVNFGAGMKSGSTCGALTGGLMALGLLGVDDAETAEMFFRTFKEKHSGCTDETFFLTHSAEDEVGVLLRNVLEFGLCSFQKTFSREATRADSDLALIYVIACPSRVFFHA